eukprot:gene2287-2594_t
MTTPTINSVTISFAIEDTITSGTLMISTKKFDFGSANIQYVDQLSQVTICIPWRYDLVDRCGASLGTASTQCPVSISYTTPTVSITLSSTTIASLFPNSNLVSYFDITPPTLDSISATVQSPSFFFKLKISDAGTGFNKGSVYLSDGSYIFIDVSTKDIDGYYYTTYSSSPIYGQDVTLTLTKIVLEDYAGNVNTITNLSGYILPTFTIVKSSVDAIPVATIQECTMTGNEVTDSSKLAIVTIKTVYNSTVFSVRPKFNMGPLSIICDSILTDTNKATSYCMIPPHSKDGTYTVDIYYLTSTGNEEKYTSEQTITYTNPNQDKPEITGLAYNVDIINMYAPFNLVINITFSNPNGVLFSTDVMGNNDFVNIVYPEINLIQGNESGGVMMLRTLFDSSVSSISPFEFDITPILTNSESKSTENIQGPTVVASTASSDRYFKINSITVPSSIDLSKDLTLPVTFSGALSGKLVYGTIFIKSGNSVVGSPLALASTVQQDSYLHGTSTTAAFQLPIYLFRTYINRPGAYGLSFTGKLESKGTFSTNLHQCVVLDYNKPTPPILTNLTVSPSNVIDVTNSGQIVTFTLTFNQSTTVPDYATVILPSTQISAPCSLSTAKIFTCSLFIPKNSLSSVSTIELQVQSNDAPFDILSAQINYLGLPSTLTINGVNQGLLATPSLTKFNVNGNILDLQIDANSQSPSITSVTVLYSASRRFSAEAQDQKLVSYSNMVVPSRTFARSVNLLPLCSTDTGRYSQAFKTLKIVVVDSNGITTTFPYGHIQSLFPFAIPAQQCDIAPPIIRQMNLSLGTSSVITNVLPTTVTVQFQATDNMAGIDYIDVLITTTGPLPLRFFLTTPTTGDSYNGVYEFQFTIPAHNTDTYTITVPNIYDKHGNKRNYNDQDLAIISNIQSSTITATSGTTTPPSTLISSNFATVVQAGQSISIGLTLGSAASQVLVNFDDRTTPVTATMSSPTTAHLTYTPVKHGLRFFSLILINSANMTTTYSYDASNSFFYQGGEYIPTTIQGLSTNVDQLTITGQFKITDLITDTSTVYPPQDIANNCVLTDNVGNTFFSTLVATSLDNYKCTIVVSQATTYHWSLVLVGQSGDLRLISSYEITEYYKLPTTVVAGTSTSSTTSPSSSPSPSSTTTSTSTPSTTTTATTSSSTPTPDYVSNSNALLSGSNYLVTIVILLISAFF